MTFRVRDQPHDECDFAGRRGGDHAFHGAGDGDAEGAATCELLRLAVRSFRSERLDEGLQGKTSPLAALR